MEDKQGEVNGCKYWETGLKYVGMSFQIGGGHGKRWRQISQSYKWTCAHSYVLREPDLFL